ncbi:FecR domain-containing protein [Xanthomonas campestris pv. phormiicola]|nr:FecR domain-containing protein [Xanthomonas campestris pv. phormiicola]UYC14963.1 FecR domain-containing protein [Xanthomonas campestris pv. phormiicola]
MSTKHHRVSSFRSCPPLRWAIALSLWLGLACAGAAADQDWTYRVRPGDTLWDLSARYLKPEVDWRRLGQHNRVADPYALPPGRPLRVPIAWLRTQPAPAQLIALRGQVSVQTADGATLSAQQGMPLPIGSALQTGADASATVQFADGSQLQLREDSRVRFDRLARFGATGMVDTRLRLEYGRSSNAVTPAQGPAAHYIIQTPSGTSSVRGTRFRVGAGSDGELAATEVLEGAVQIANGRGQRLLRPGQAARMPADTAPLQEPLLPPPAVDAARSRLDRPPYVLAWQPLPGASHYRIEAVDADRPQVLRFAHETGQSRIALDALPAGRLRVLVRGIAATGVEGEDAEQALQVWATPLPPLTVWPLHQQPLHEPRPRFEWTRNPEAAASVLQLARDPQFQDLLFERQTRDTRLRAPQALPAGDYFWRVASRDAQARQGPFGQPRTLRISAAPVDPALAPPLAAKGQLTLRWQAGTPTQRYRVQIARRPDFAAPLLDRNVATPQVSLPRPRRGTWYVRIQTVDDDGYAAPFSPPQAIAVPCRYCTAGGTASGALLLWLLL